MNTHYKLIDIIKKNYFLNLNTQRFVNVGDKIFISFVKSEKKEYNFNGIIISKNFTELNRSICVHRTVENTNFWHIINLKSPIIIEIQILKKKKIKRSKLYYTRYFTDKFFSLF